MIWLKNDSISGSAAAVMIRSAISLHTSSAGTIQFSFIRMEPSSVRICSGIPWNPSIHLSSILLYFSIAESCFCRAASFRFIIESRTEFRDGFSRFVIPSGSIRDISSGSWNTSFGRKSLRKNRDFSLRYSSVLLNWLSSLPSSSVSAW